LEEFLSSCPKHVDLATVWLVVACERQAVSCHSAKGDPSANNLIAMRLAAFESRDVVNGCGGNVVEASRVKSAWWPVTIISANWPNRHRHIVDLPFSDVNLM
jgi:hypothetical protein